MNGTVEFRYYKPLPSKKMLDYGLTVGIILGIVCMTQWFMAGAVILGVCVILLNGSGILVSSLTKNMKGAFVFDANSVTFTSLGRKTTIPYTAISAVIREYYEEDATAAGVVHYTQPVPNQYRIQRESGPDLVLRVSVKEQKSHRRTIQALLKKIYGMNSLGVSFDVGRRPVKEDAVTRRQKDIQFDREKPSPDFSLERAVRELLARSGRTLADLTEEQPRAAKKRASKRHAIAEGMYVELAKCITNNDADAVATVFERVERWERYRADSAKRLHRGITPDTPQEDVRWLGMVDALEEHGYTAEIDWKDGYESIASALDRIKAKLGIHVDTAMDLTYMDGNEHADRLETPRILNLIALNTDEQGYCLTNLDIDGDSYAICLLPHKIFRQCEKILKTTPFSLSAF